MQPPSVRLICSLVAEVAVEADTAEVAVEAMRAVVVAAEAMRAVVVAAVTLAAVAAVEDTLVAAASAEAAVDGQLVVIAAEAVQCTVLLLGCERLQGEEMPADNIRQVRFARHRSVNHTVQVNFAHRKELAIWDQLATLGLLDNRDQVVCKVLVCQEPTRGLATSHEV